MKPRCSSGPQVYNRMGPTSLYIISNVLSLLYYSISKPWVLNKYCTMYIPRFNYFFPQPFHVWTDKKLIISDFFNEKWASVHKKSMHISTVWWLSIIMSSRSTRVILLLCLGILLTVYPFKSGTAGPYMVSSRFTFSSVTEKLTLWLCVMMYLSCWDEWYNKCYCISLYLFSP